LNKIEAITVLAILAFITLAGLSIIMKGAAVETPFPQPSASIQPTALLQTQTVQLSVKNGYYEPRTITVPKGTRLRIEADANTFGGYMTILLIPDFGISKTITSTDNVVEFVADKTGSFAFHCPMGMGQGTLIVN